MCYKIEEQQVSVDQDELGSLVPLGLDIHDMCIVYGVWELSIHMYNYMDDNYIEVLRSQNNMLHYGSKTYIIGYHTE